MKKRTLLIATTNQGKQAEILEKFHALPFDIITLEDLPNTIPAPDEYGQTIEENALIKAQYYALHSGHLTVADDAGLYINALDGWPGVHSARVADIAVERISEVLFRLDGVENRSALFRAAVALYDPKDKSVHMTTGKTELEISTEPIVGDVLSWGYNPILVVPELGKSYSQLTIQEKNEQSHRGKALTSMYYYLEGAYAHKNIPVGFALVVQDGKVLMQLRNDPYNPNFHKRWEFPGGGIDFGETMHQNIIRETKEESGLDVQVERLLQHVQIESHIERSRPYQIILLPFVCSVVGGSISHCDTEVLDAQWFAIDDILEQPLVGNNKDLVQKLLPELKEFLQDNPL